MPITLTAAQKEERQSFLEAQKSVPPPSGANTALEAAFFSQGAEYRAKYCNPEKDICKSLYSLCLVQPDTIMFHADERVSRPSNTCSYPDSQPKGNCLDVAKTTSAGGGRFEGKYMPDCIALWSACVPPTCVGEG